MQCIIVQVRYADYQIGNAVTKSCYVRGYSSSRFRISLAGFRNFLASFKPRRASLFIVFIGSLSGFKIPFYTF